LSAGKRPTASPGATVWPARNNGVAGDARAVANDGGHQRGVVVVVRRVGLGVDAGEGADDCSLANFDAAAIVQQRSLTDGDPIPNAQVVAVGQIDAVMDPDA